MPESKQGLPEHGRASGSTTPEPFASYDPATSSWRTSQPLLTGDSTVFSGRWPRSGTMRNGVVSAQPTWVPRTSATGSGSWPTPTANSSNMCSVPAALNEVQRLHPRGHWTLMSQVTAEAVYGNRLWLTPAANEDAAGSIHGKMQQMLTHQVKRADMEATLAGGQLNPTWVAWLMGFPLDWLSCVALAMLSSHSVRRSSTKRLPDERTNDDD